MELHFSEIDGEYRGTEGTVRGFESQLHIIVIAGLRISRIVIHYCNYLTYTVG